MVHGTYKHTTEFDKARVIAKILSHYNLAVRKAIRKNHFTVNRYNGQYVSDTLIHIIIINMLKKYDHISQTTKKRNNTICKSILIQ